MREGWRQLTLADVADVIVGGTPSTKTPEYWDGDLVWVTPTDITGNDGVRLTGSARKITQAGLEASSARVVPRGSTLVTTRATIGPAVIAGTEVSTNQGVTALVPNKELVDPQWLFAWVRGNAREFQNRGAGNTFPEIARSKTRTIPIVVPPIEEQERIADLIQALDRVVERINLAIVLSLALNTKTREALLGAAGHLKPLDSALDGIDAGKSPRAADRPPAEGERGVLKVSAVRPGEFEPWESKTLDDDTVMPERARVSAGDLLITRANTRELVGAVCRVSETPDDLFLCDKTLRLRVNADKALPEYLVFALAGASVRSQIELNATGTSGSMKNVSQQTIRNLRMPLPPLETQARIAAACGDGAETRRALKRSMTRALQLRQALLTALVRGDHEIPEAYDRLIELTRGADIAEA